MRPLRVAVVGAGHLGRIHARILSGLAGVTLAGVFDASSEQCQRVAAEFGTQALPSAEHLEGLVDAAVVATPTRFHRDVALQLMGQGIHVLVEKPLAGTVAECEALVDEARRRQVVLQVGHVERFNPALIAAQPYLRDVKYVEAVRRGPYSFRSTDIGVVLDLMIHDLDVLLAVVRSPVVRVEAIGIAVFGAHEDVANARLVFANGCVASLSASRASQSAARVMQAFAARSFTAIDFGARTASVVRPSEALLRRELALDDVPAAQRPTLKDELFGQHLPAQKLEVVDRDQITAELEDFVASIREGRAPVVTGEQARDAVGVAERILESMASHCWNGTLDGPMGPLAQLGPQILRGPHWPGTMADAPSQREIPGQGHQGHAA